MQAEVCPKCGESDDLYSKDYIVSIDDIGNDVMIEIWECQTCWIGWGNSYDKDGNCVTGDYYDLFKDE